MYARTSHSKAAADRSTSPASNRPDLGPLHFTPRAPLLFATREMSPLAVSEEEIMVTKKVEHLNVNDHDGSLRNLLRSRFEEAEDIDEIVTLAIRYGLMDPDAFDAEMRERIHSEDESYAST
jgi:hypothetical protein